MSSINPEYLRLQELFDTNYTTPSNITDLTRWLNYRRYFVLATHDKQLKWTPEGLKLIQEGLKEIEDQILKLLNITR